MYTRSNSLSIQTKNNSELFAYRTMHRSEKAEIFTFELIPADEPKRHIVRRRRKNIRVQYPANVRKYLPAAEKSPAKRWLVALCLVMFLQIYTEEAFNETPISEDRHAAEVPKNEFYAQYQVIPFQSADEQARQIRDDVNELPSVNCQSQLIGQQGDNIWRKLINRTCPDWEADINRMHQQSTGNGYVVALIYPAVYHRL